MTKRLIVAEKPSVGRDIANVLNCRENRPGCRVGDNDIVTWAIGHLVGLCYPEEMDEKYKEWKVEDLPLFPEPFQLKVLESSARQYEIVKELMNDPEVDRIVCATDAGREGELIFRYIYQMAGCDKPVDRLWISSLTYRAIKEGFENLKPDTEYDNLYESARCRSEADWLIGMNGSRAYAIENDMRGLSVGRVLSPTLSILVKRELERRSFVPQEYCELTASFDGFSGHLINPRKKGAEDWSQFSMDQKEELEEFAKNHSAEGTVIESANTEETRPALQLYDLTSLQRDANRLYGMPSKRTLDTAQNLYEKRKAITYPRTDSRYLSADLKSTLQKRLESLLDGELKPYAKQAIRSEKDLFGRFINDKGVSDHHAMIPTGEAKDIESWSNDEKRIYDLISRRFIGMFLPDRTAIQQTIMTSVDGRVFLSAGEKVTEAGWSAVDTSRKSTLSELPDHTEGDRISVTGMRVHTDVTKPPLPHTEASLLSTMEHAGKIVPEEGSDDRETEFGIGTPATRAATIEKMLEKEMAVRKGRALIPTEYGIKLISILPPVLQSPEMTGEWEAKLARINKGEGSPKEFMEGIRELTAEVVNCAAEQGNTGIRDANSVGTCPLCGSPVREYASGYSCRNKECGFRRIYKAVKGSHPTLNSITMRELLENETAVTEKGTYTLMKEPPYIRFEYAPKPEPDYKALKALIEEYGVTPVDKVHVGGGLWLPGDRDDEMMQDFVKDAREIGCLFEYSNSSKALRYKSGWYHRVTPEYKPVYEAVMEGKEPPAVSAEPEAAPVAADDDPVLNLVRESGFEYADKRASGGSLWIIAGDEAKELIAKCGELGVRFLFSSKGGKASKKKPAWYSVKK